MFLKVIGKPAPHGASEFQHLCATYDPGSGVYLISCDVDVITLGVALNVLKKEYEECLARLSPELAERIRKTTEEAVRNEQDRS